MIRNVIASEDLLHIAQEHPADKWRFDPGVSGHEELMGAVDILHREGEVERDERDMFGGLLELSEIPVSDVMVHRTKMRLIDADLPPEELVREVIASPYTRMPLWRGEPDNIVGVLHAKDLLRAYVAAGGDASKLNIADLTLEPWFIPKSTTCATNSRRSCAEKLIRRSSSTNTGSCRGS